jgi:hypothetical protein
MRLASLSANLGRLHSASTQIAWVLFLVCLPVTSFPLFPKTLGGSALVRPLSLFPLLALLALAVLPRLLSRPAPRTLLTLLPFTLVAIASSLLSTLRGIEPTFGVTVNDRILRALITLATGSAMYVTVAILPLTPEELRRSLRWLYAGFGIALLWGSLQAVYVVEFDSSYYKFLARVQEIISTRDLFTTRISGLTYEPNWFAMQISQLLLPWLLGSVITGYSVFKRRWRWLTVEWIMLVWAVGVLIFTFSRAGLAVLVFLVFITLLVFRSQRQSNRKPGRRPWLRRLVEAGLGIALVAGLIYAASTQSPFFARLWNYWTIVKGGTLEGYIEYVGFRARLTYSEAALNTYASSPWLGIGLGNYAFYFSDMLPDRPLAVAPELLRIVLPDDSRDRLITPKNYFLRLLAETGLVGVAAFAGFLFAILGCALFLWTARDGEQHFWGVSGLLGVASFLAASFSFDSFAIPNTWIVFGLITAAAWVYFRQEQK